MPTQVVSIGPALTLVQNQVYALPAKLVVITALAAVDVSVNGTTWVALAGATSGALTGSVFIRSTTAGNIVVAKDASRSQALTSTAESQALQAATAQALQDITHFELIPNPSVPQIRDFLRAIGLLVKLIIVRLNQLQ